MITQTNQTKINNYEISDLLRKHGAKTGEELKAEGKLVAKGEVVVTDEKLAVQITDVVNASPEN